MLTMTRESEGQPMRQGEASGTTVNSALQAGMAWWDLMLRMQRASLASFSVYSPSSGTRISANLPAAVRAGTQVLPVGEERLNVATRTELGETTRIRRRVVARPVEQEVTLRDERVVVERRPAPRREDAPANEVLTETVIEMSDSRQVPQVWKSIHVAEEVVLRREVTERTERVREMLRRDVVEIEHDSEGRPSSRKDAEDEAGAAGSALSRETEAARERTEALAEAARRATVAAASDPGRPAPGQQQAGPTQPVRAGQQGAASASAELRPVEDAKDRASQPASSRKV